MNFFVYSFFVAAPLGFAVAKWSRQRHPDTDIRAIIQGSSLKDGLTLAAKVAAALGLTDLAFTPVHRFVFGFVFFLNSNKKEFFLQTVLFHAFVNICVYFFT